MIADDALKEELSELIAAIACLSEQIDNLHIKQSKDTQKVERSLAEWSQLNQVLMEVIHSQAENAQEHIGHQQALAINLLQSGKSTKSLEVSSVRLEGSLSKLTHYLQENHSIQLVELQNSTSQLMQYLKGEQLQRIKVLEEGMTALIEIMEQIPEAKNLKTRPKKGKRWNFDLGDFFPRILASSLLTTMSILVVWQLSGVGKQITRSEERSIWSIMKLENIESYFGI